MIPSDQPDSTAPDASHDAALLQALQEYRAADKAARVPLRRELLARFPKVADLATRLDDLDFLLAAATHGVPTLSSPAVAAAAVGADMPTLGDFRLLRELGRGGMGVVYEAEQISLGRRVALKVLPFAAALDPRQLQRFQNEAQAAAHLHHQHIVPVHAVGHDRNVHFYAMQLIEGQSLAGTLQELRHSSGLERRSEPPPASGPLTTRLDTPAPTSRSGRPQPGPCLTLAPEHCRWAAALAADAAEALDHAHALGVVHRDVKPGNLLLDKAGHLWVTDFGVAQVLNDTRLTQTGDRVGTLSYMSPEQALGQRHGVDHRTDVYALGATLYELLTLRQAFTATDPQELLRQIAQEEPRAPSRLNSAVPHDLDTIVLKALAKAPDERYATAQELADDLRRYLNNETIRARRPTALQRARKWAQRHRALVASSIVFSLLLLLLSLAGLGVSNVLISREKQQAVADRHRAKQAEFAARLAQARASRWSKRVGQRHATWAALQEAAALADELKLGEAQRRELRDEAIGSLALHDLRPLKEIQAVGQDGTSTTLTADLELYSRSDSEGNLSIRRVEDDRELAVLPCTGYEGSRKAAVFQQFSPNGALLAVRHDQGNGARHNVRLWDWQRGKLLFEPAANFPSDSLDFSPDSRHLALGRPDGVLTLHNTANGAETRQIVLGLRPTFLAYHPDGSKLVVANQNTGEVQVRALPDGKLLRRWTAPHGICSLAWHPDGELLATGHHDYCVYLWDTRQGQARGTLRGHQGSVAGRLSFAPDGSTLVSSAWDGSCRLWDVWAQRELLRFSGMDGRFSLDGRRLAARRGHDLAVWEVTLSQECRPLPRSSAANRAGFHGGSVSPDGRWLALGSYHGAGLWDLARNQAAAFVPVGTVQDVQFHPSGRELFVSTQAGLAALPVTTERQRLIVGPLKVPLLTGNLCRLGLDRAGRILAVSELHGAGVHVLDPNQRASETRLLAHRGTTGAAVSPDGNWIASAVQHGEGIKVWEARTGQLLRHLFPDRRDLKSFFSPDSGELWTASTTAYTAWAVGDWEPAWEIRRETGTDGAGSAAFTRDGTILAVTLTQATIQLFDRSTRRPLGRLQASDTDRFNQLLFNADGSQLVSISGEGDAWLWDLRRLRERLTEIGLDWDQPPYPPATVPSAMRVEVKLGWWPGLMP